MERDKDKLANEMDVRGRGTQVKATPESDAEDSQESEGTPEMHEEGTRPQDTGATTGGIRNKAG
jgi:hypothetical protein